MNLHFPFYCLWRCRALVFFTSLSVGVFLSLSVSLPALAQADANSAPQASADTGAGALNTLLKKPAHDVSDDTWFFYLSAGLGRPNYDSETQSKIDAQKAAGGSSEQAGFADLPGIYRKVSPTLALGAILAMSFENVSGDWHEGRSFAVQTYHPSLSALYFPSETFGLGWFGRADVGPTRIYERLATRTSANGDVVRESNEDGYHAQLGLGYGFRASSVARVLIHLNGLYAAAGPAQMSGVSLNIGFLL